MLAGVQLRDSFLRLTSLLDECLTHISIVDLISDRASEINESHFAAFFARTQDTSLRMSSILLCSIFASSTRNKLISLPHFLHELKCATPCARTLRSELHRAPWLFPYVEQIADGGMGAFFLDRANDFLRSPETKRMLLFPKQFRDQHVAHKDLDSPIVSSINIEECKSLCDSVGIFLSIAGSSYFSIFIGDEKRWFIPLHAAKTKASLVRVLERCELKGV